MGFGVYKPNMRGQNSTADTKCVATLLFLMCSAVICESIESNQFNSSTSSVYLDKFNCNRDYIIGNYAKNETNSSLTDINSITLKCSKDDIVYTNITEKQFMESEYNGVLQHSILNRKFDANEFCLVHKYVSHHTTSGQDDVIYRIALCNEAKEWHYTNYADLAKLEIRKCCKPNQRLDVNTYHENGTVAYKCLDIPINSKQREWKPAIFESTSDDYSMHKDLEDVKEAVYYFGYPNCAEMKRSLNNSKDIWFMLLEDGSVQIGLKFWFKPVWLPVEDNNFCLDEVVDHDPTLHNASEIDSHKIYHKNQILLYCQIDNFNDYVFHRFLFGGMCVTAAGIVFILLIIYVAIWDKQNLAGWTQFNIFVALFFVVLMEGLRTLLDTNALKVRSTPTCVIIAAIAQYFFFALNTTWTVMCFDLFYMFWKLETTSKTVARYRNRLAGYLLFSWGVPLFVVCTAFYFTHSTATEAMNEMKGVYAFAHRRCSSPIRKLGFQTQGIMFLLNLLFFLLTTALIWKHRRGINPARKKTRNERHTWRSVTLFFKLVVVMGVTSLSIPADYFFGSSDPLSTISVCFRLVHFIPFFAVLFIFGFNEKNVALISQKYPRFGKYFGFVACNPKANGSETVNHSRSVNVNHTPEFQSTSQT